MHRNSSASVCVLLSCTADCAGRYKNCRNLLERKFLNMRDVQKRCGVRAFVYYTVYVPDAVCSCAREMTTELNIT